MSTRPGWPVPLHVMSQSDIRDPREAALEERLRLEFGLALWPIAEGAGAAALASMPELRSLSQGMITVYWQLSATSAAYSKVPKYDGWLPELMPTADALRL